MTAKISKLVPSAGSPPRPLAEEGTKFWAAVQREFQFNDAAGVEMLLQIAEALDRIARFEARIAAEGEVLEGPRGGLQVHPLIAPAQTARGFVMRSIDKLGVAYEPLKDIGRPGGFATGWRG